MPPVGASFCIVCGAALTVGVSQPPQSQPLARPQPIRNTARLPPPAPSTAPLVPVSALSLASMLVLWPPHAAELPSTPLIRWRRACFRLRGVRSVLLQRCAVRAVRVLTCAGRARRPDAWARPIVATIISAGIAAHMTGLPALVTVTLVAMLSIVLAPWLSRQRRAPTSENAPCPIHYQADTGNGRA